MSNDECCLYFSLILLLSNKNSSVQVNNIIICIVFNFLNSIRIILTSLEEGFTFNINEKCTNKQVIINK